MPAPSSSLGLPGARGSRGGEIPGCPRNSRRRTSPPRARRRRPAAEQARAAQNFLNCVEQCAQHLWPHSQTPKVVISWQRRLRRLLTYKKHDGLTQSDRIVFISVTDVTLMLSVPDAVPDSRDSDSSDNDSSDTMPTRPFIAICFISFGMANDQRHNNNVKRITFNNGNSQKTIYGKFMVGNTIRHFSGLLKVLK